MAGPVTFLYLQQEEVKACGGLNMAATIAAVETAFRLFDQGEVMEVPLPVIHWGNRAGRRIAMHAAYIGGTDQIAGLKWIPSNPDNPHTLQLPRSNALTILTDPQTGYPLAILEGKLISDMRTGAVCGLGAKYLARPGASSVGLIGGGPINRVQLMALHQVLPRLERVAIYDIRRERAERFVADMCGRLSIPAKVFSLAPTAEAAVRDADVITTATNVDISGRYLQWGWLRPGALVVNTSINDIDFDVVKQANLVVLDSQKQLATPEIVMAEAYKRRIISDDRLTQIGAIVTGRHPGRRGADEVILFSPLGMGMNDVINAKRIYDTARERGVGTTLKLWDSPEWF
jgi:ornithine cyclodeaminase